MNFPVSAVRNIIDADRTSVIRKINTKGTVLAKAVAAVCIFPYISLCKHFTLTLNLESQKKQVY